MPSLHLKMQTTDLVKNACLGMHVPVNVGALQSCRQRWGAEQALAQLYFPNYLIKLLYSHQNPEQKCMNVHMLEWACVSVNSLFVSKNVCKVHTCWVEFHLNSQIMICTVRVSVPYADKRVFCSRETQKSCTVKQKAYGISALLNTVRRRS